MPKSIDILPQQVLAKGKIHFTDIDINAYSKTVEEEKVLFTKDDFLNIYFDMCVIREFETALHQVKKQGAYKDLPYYHYGPAHLSIGQEATAVGMAYTLLPEDHIFGSHRSHGETLAKGFSAIRCMNDRQLLDIMKTWLNGIILDRVEKDHNGSVKELAFLFMIYGTYSEIFARETGFNKGLGGSMHVFFPPFGIYPNNAIVGGSGSIAPGAALWKRVNRKKGIVIANIGDASFGCGPVWEGMTFASMDQYRHLWDPALGGGLPILFHCITNHYGMGGQPYGETMGCQYIARIGAGVNPEQMHAERVNGYDPLAVIDAIQRKKQVLIDGNGPVLLETVTYRYSGHSPSDASSYRSKEEIKYWSDVDAIVTYRNKIIQSHIASEKELDDVKNKADTMVYRIFQRAVDLKSSPRLNMDSDYIGKVMFSNQKVEKWDDRAPELNQRLEDNSRVQQIKNKVRKIETKGNKVPKANVYTLRDGIFEALIHRFVTDPTLIAFGEENRDWGGAFAVYQGLTELLPYHRLFNAPISEAAIVGAAVGYALEGGRVVAELMYADFMGRAGDELFNQLSKWQAMSAGQLFMPVVLRISIGSKYGAQHSQDWSSLSYHIPGLKVVYPVTPYDAKGMMNAALAGTDPVLFFESQKIYDVGEMFQEDGVPEGYYEIDLSEPSIKKPGDDLTLITFGPFLYKAIEAAEELKHAFGVSAEVIDLRTINPLNYERLIESVQKTGRVILGSDAVERGSALHTIAAHLTQFCFNDLDAPPVVIGAKNWITPAAEMETMFFPQKEWIIDAIHERILPLKHYQSKSYPSLHEMKMHLREGN